MGNRLRRDVPRRQRLEELRAASWTYAETHERQFPADDFTAGIPEERWRVVGDSGRSPAYEPGLFGRERWGLFADGDTFLRWRWRQVCPEAAPPRAARWAFSSWGMSTESLAGGVLRRRGRRFSGAARPALEPQAPCGYLPHPLRSQPGTREDAEQPVVPPSRD